MAIVGSYCKVVQTLSPSTFSTAHEISILGCAEDIRV